MNNGAVARLGLPLISRRMIVLAAAFLLLAAVAVSASQAPTASAQIGYTLPITYGSLGYGNYGLGYGGLYGGLGYGGLYGGLGYGGLYGLGYNNFGYGSGYSYPSLTNYLTSNAYNYGSTYTVSQNYTSSTPNIPLAVGASWTYCTGPNGPLWIRVGQSTVGLIC